jgi:hypothetical protein
MNTRSNKMIGKPKRVTSVTSRRIEKIKKSIMMWIKTATRVIKEMKMVVVNVKRFRT